MLPCDVHQCHPLCYTAPIIQTWRKHVQAKRDWRALMAKLRRTWDMEQWVGPYPWPNDEPPEYPGPDWQFCWGYWVGLVHPEERWGEALTFQEHTLLIIQDCWTGMHVTNCGFPIGLRADVYSLADCEAWANAAAARLARWPERILITCPGCRLGGHPYMPF
jgi:hypothetical protein